MDNEKFISIIKKNLIFLSLITGGIQLILFSFDSLIGMAGFHDINQMFFKLDFIPANIRSFWSIYLLCYGFVVCMEKIFIKENFDLNFSWISTASHVYAENILLLQPLLIIWIDSFTRFSVSLIVYLLKKDFVSLKRIFSFSDGFFSWYLKLWIIFLIIIYFYKQITYAKSLKQDKKYS